MQLVNDFLSLGTRRIFLILAIIGLTVYAEGLAATISHMEGSPISLPEFSVSTRLSYDGSLFVTQQPYLSLGLIILGIFIGTIGEFESRSVIDIDYGSRRFWISPRLDYTMLLFGLTLGAILVWTPRMIQSLPIGSDTLYYISVIETTSREGIVWPIVYTDRPLLYIFLAAIQNLSGLSTIDFFKILPVGLAVLTVGSVWYFVRGFYPQAAGFSAIFTAASIALMRTSIDLYASFAGMILLFLFIGTYYRYRETKTMQLRILSALFLVILLGCYWFVWLLAIAMVVITEFSTKERILRIKSLLPILLPSILGMVLLVCVAVIFPPPQYWGLGSSFALYLGKATTPHGVITYNSTNLDQSALSLLGQDNLIIPFLAATGLLLLTPRTFQARTIYVWTIVLLIASILSTTSVHAALLIPLPALAGIGLRKLIELL